MSKIFILLGLVATCQQSNAFGFGSLFSGLTSSVANSTSGILLDSTSGVNDVTSTLNMRVAAAVSKFTSSASDDPANFSMTFAESTNRSVVSSAIAAAQTALNNVASAASSSLSNRDSTAEPLAVANIVSTAENAVSSAISGLQGSTMSLSDTINDAVTSAASSNNFLSRIIEIITRFTAIFTKFITNASSGNVITALQQSFSSGLGNLSRSVKSLHHS